MKDDTMDRRFCRSRIRYGAACALTMALGLASRRLPSELQAWIGKYPGDALWALMVFLALCAIWPSVSARRVAMYALIIAFGIEILKRYSIPWLDPVRATVIGRLIFGYAFSWGNLLAYTVGIALGTLLEAADTHPLTRSIGPPEADT